MDRLLIEKLEELCKFDHTMEDGVCTRLSFYDENELLGGTIRRHPAKQHIMSIVKQFRHLKHLNLRKCNVGDFDMSGSFEHLDLSCNQLERFPAWANVPTLRYLDVGANRISAVPDFVGELSLEVLKLHKNRIPSIPRLQPTVRTLNLYLNGMEEVPEIDYLPLETFAFGVTSIKRLPSLPRTLRWLTLVANEIEELPDDFSSLDRLEGVRLAKNRLKHLPEDVGRMNLRQITLYSNDLTYLPESFFSLRLDKLNLSRNPLRCRERVLSVFSGISFLEV